MQEEQCYRSEINDVVGSEKDSTTTRMMLVSDILANQIDFPVGGQKVNVSGRIDERNKACIARVTAFVDRISICHATTEFKQDGTIVFSFKKDYLTENSGVRGKGLITACSELLVQLLIQESINECRGEVGQNNILSINTRLQMSDYIRGGYFLLDIFADYDKEGLDTLVTCLKQPNIDIPQHYYQVRLSN